MSYVIAHSRPWYNNLAKNLEKKTASKFYSIDNKHDLNKNYLLRINPKYIFFPHWSYVIPKDIYNNYKCIIFHMTDLPYGRGGSPLQNLIIRGHKQTVISAIKCVEEIDAGPVYLKEPLSLEGTAQEIFLRSTKLIEKMIINFIKKEPLAIPQKGKVVKFQRRKPKQSNLTYAKSLDQIYDFIRMLDADGYPNAFIKLGKFKFTFSKSIRNEKFINAQVKISKENENE
tara:strand:+ start:1060 stop:1743 length:684 start_codon:yes stop_codon:yes gene_type:complete